MKIIVLYIFWWMEASDFGIEIMSYYIFYRFLRFKTCSKHQSMKILLFSSLLFHSIFPNLLYYPVHEYMYVYREKDRNPFCFKMGFVREQNPTKMGTLFMCLLLAINSQLFPISCLKCGEEGLLNENFPRSWNM